jgi:hypothetical protein
LKEKNMMKKKVIGVALAGALALGAWSGASVAAPITVGGITWDPANGADLTVQAIDFRESSVAAVGDTLTGYGRIGSINGEDQSVFCSGCSLNFTFQYTVSAIEGTALNPKVVFDGGLINFYVDPTGSFDVANPSSAGVGTGPLWLSLTGHTAPFTGFSAVGDLYSNINGPISAPGSLSGGFGLLDVNGGAAGYWMDTNSRADGADFDLSSAFSFMPYAQCSGVTGDPTDICHYPIVGTGTLTGKSLAVPEPGPIGMLGVGLGLMGLLLRRRSKESELGA